MTRTWWMQAVALVAFVGGGVPNARSDRADEADKYLRKTHFSGAVLIAVKDSIVLRRGYGLASIELAVPNAATTRFRIHSITKSIVAAGVLILASQGRIDLSAPLRTYLPELPASWASATVAQVLNHTSGLPQAEDRWFAARQATTEPGELTAFLKLAAELANDSLQFAPGTRWQYNNFGYDLLGCLIERRAGRSLGEYLASALFAPLGMGGAGFDRGASVAAGTYRGSAPIVRLASGYNGSDSTLQVASPSMWGSAGAGGVFATVDDLYRFERGLRLGRAVPRRFWDSTPAYQVNDTVSYHMGWVVRRGRYTVRHHSGGDNGYSSDLARYEEAGLTIVVLSNHGQSDAEAVRADLGKLFLDAGRIR